MKHGKKTKKQSTSKETSPGTQKIKSCNHWIDENGCKSCGASWRELEREGYIWKGIE